jgi:hypothetical protein
VFYLDRKRGIRLIERGMHEAKNNRLNIVKYAQRFCTVQIPTYTTASSHLLLYISCKNILHSVHNINVARTE